MFFSFSFPLILPFSFLIFVLPFSFAPTFPFPLSPYVLRTHLLSPTTVMVESIGFAPGQIGLLFTFLARQMAKHEEAEEERIHVPPTLFGQVFEFLCGGGGEEEEEEDEDGNGAPSGGVIDERQEAVLELLHVSGFSMVGLCGDTSVIG